LIRCRRSCFIALLVERDIGYRIPERVSPARAEVALFCFDNGKLLSRVNTVIGTYPYEPVRIWWRKAT
jgi:hypothetical protein